MPKRDFFLIFDEPFSDYTQEIINSLYYDYFVELSQNIENFSHLSYLIDIEYRDLVKEEYLSKTDLSHEFRIKENVNADLQIISNVISKLNSNHLVFQQNLNDLDRVNRLKIEFADYLTKEIRIRPFDKEWIEKTTNRQLADEEESLYTNYLHYSPKIIDLLLATIPEDKSYLGLTEHIDIIQSKLELHHLLKNIKNGAELFQKLRTSTTYWHNILYSRFTTPRRDKEGNIVVVLERNVAMMQIVTYFKKQIVNFIQTNVKENNRVTLIDKNRDIKLKPFLIGFEKRFKENFDIKPDEISIAKISDYRQKFEKLKSLDGYHFLNSLGFDVGADFDQYCRKENIHIGKIIGEIKFYNLVKVNDLRKLIETPAKVNRIKKIAEIVADYERYLTPIQVFSADNKPMYSIIERNFISKKLDELKRKFEGNDSIEAQRINDAEIVYNLGVSTENDVQKANKLSETPSFIMHINNMLHNISPFIATGDKSSYFGFKNLAKVYSQPIVEEEINDRYISLYKNILKQEFNTFVKYKSADEDVVMPWIEEHFGVSNMFYISINNIKSKGIEEKLFVNNTLRFTDFNSFYNSDNFKDGFEKAVIEYTEKKVESLTKKLYDSGIAEGDKINFVDKESLRQTSTYSGYDLAHKLHLFILESNYMQSKYMIGDIGFYGMNLNKRVPKAMATKKEGNYNVAVAGLLKTHPVYGRKAKFDFNKTIDGELVFDALVHDDLFFKDEKLEKLFSKYGETNIADGAAMEHIEAIRFREWAKGTWTPEDEALYQLDLDNKLDFESSVRFVRKEFYFGDQLIMTLPQKNDGFYLAPISLKMVIFPVTNSFIEKFDELNRLKTLMEKTQIPIFIESSGCFIGRKNGYKLFDERGILNERVAEFKQLLFWKYF
jgi:hypothetical protein